MPATTQPGPSRPAVLVIAATDSSGGAGLIRDIRVLTDFSIDALCVTTAVTAQSDNRVSAVHHIPPEIIRAQLTAALETRRVGAIKIGMLGTRTTVETVAQSLAARKTGDAQPRGDESDARNTRQTVTPGEWRDDVAGTTQAVHIPATATSPDGQPDPSIPIVLDPVLVSSSGGILLDAPGRTALLENLLPRVTLLTPNVPELAALLGEPVATTEPGLIDQGRRLLKSGCQAILLKGGHAHGEEAIDILVSAAGVERITSKRVPATSRGTGCALASAIAASLASGQSLLEACKRAKHYVLETMLTR